MKSLRQCLKRLERRTGGLTRGVAIVEYALLVFLISLVMVPALVVFGPAIAQKFQAVAGPMLPNTGSQPSDTTPSSSCSTTPDGANLIANHGPNESMTSNGYGVYVWPTDPGIIVLPAKYNNNPSVGAASLPWLFQYTPDAGATQTAMDADGHPTGEVPADPVVMVDPGNWGWLGPKDVSFNQVGTTPMSNGKLTISPMQTGVPVGAGCKYSVSVYSAETLDYGTPPAASSATGVAWFDASGTLISESVGSNLAFNKVSVEWGWNNGDDTYGGADGNEWTNEPSGTYTAPAGAVTGRPFVRYTTSASNQFMTSTFNMQQAA